MKSAILYFSIFVSPFLMAGSFAKVDYVKFVGADSKTYIEYVWFSKKPCDKKTKLTIVPLSSALPPLNLTLWKSQKASNAVSAPYSCQAVTTNKQWLSARTNQSGKRFFKAYIQYPSEQGLTVRSFVRPEMLPQQAGVSLENMEVFLEKDGKPYKTVFKTCIKGNFGFDGFDCDYTSTKTFVFNKGAWSKSKVVLPR